MKIYDIIEGEEAIKCYPTFGPIFSGCQIRIFDNAFKEGGSTFEKGSNYKTEEDFYNKMLLDNDMKPYSASFFYWKSSSLK